MRAVTIAGLRRRAIRAVLSNPPIVEPMKFLLSSVALLLAVTAHAQATPEPKMVSKDELRVCVNTELDLVDRRKAILVRNEETRPEGDAIRAEAEELAAEAKRLEGSNDMRMNRFNRKVKAHNERVAAAQGKAAAIKNDMEALNKEMVAYNASCGGISYSREDKEDILKERAAKAPKN